MDQATGDAIVAVTPARASQITGISERRLKRWDESGLLKVHTMRQLSERNTVRLYDFAALIDLRVIAALHDLGRPIHQIHRVLNYIRAHYDYSQPLQQLRFAVVGKEILFQHPDGKWEGDAKPGQIVLEQVLHLDLIQKQVRKAIKERRGTKTRGKVERRRKVFGGKPVFQGTRVPIEAVQSFIKEGYTVKAILEAYPNLTEADVRAARRSLQSA